MLTLLRVGREVQGDIKYVRNPSVTQVVLATLTPLYWITVLNSSTEIEHAVQSSSKI